MVMIMTNDARSAPGGGDQLAVFDAKTHPVDEVLKPGSMLVFPGAAHPVVH